MVENAPGKQDLSLFTVYQLTLHVSRFPILQYIPHRTPVSPFPSYFTVYLALQSGSAVGGRKCPWEAGFVAIYGVCAHFACLQSPYFTVYPSSWQALFLVFSRCSRSVCMSPEWLCRRVWTMLLASTFPRVFTVLALSLHVSRRVCRNQKGLLIQTLFSCSILRLEHVQKPTGNPWETRRKPSGNRHEIHRKSSQNHKDTLRKPSRRPPDTNLVQLFDITTGTREETYRKPSGNPQETIRKPTGNPQEIARNSSA